MKYFHYYKNSVLLTIIGLALSFFLGWYPKGSFSVGFAVFFICLTLAILEISLSFDNAIVNARILNDMTPIWQRRFLTIGIFIAVFLMRLVFPIIIVSLTTGLNIIAALRLAVFDEERYAQIMLQSHISLSAFGGMFLLLVGLGYFFDKHKKHHWLKPIEAVMSQLANIPSISVFISIIFLLLFISFLPHEERFAFLLAALYGLLVFLALDGLGHLLEKQEARIKGVGRGGALAFLYLEVLDASFSLDGVIGAFALSKNIFIIAIGLGIGALYVRSMTVMLVKERSLVAYPYLEHGAFYAIFCLGVMMYLGTIIEIPEYITGLIGIVFIATSWFSSLKENRKLAQQSSQT